MCKQPFTPPFSATDQPGAPLYLGTTYNLLANLVAHIRNAHPAPSIYGEDGVGQFHERRRHPSAVQMEYDQ